MAPLRMVPGGGPRHALTVDLEDWHQSVLGGGRPASHRFRAGADRLLNLLACCDVRATFFVLGNLAEHSPDFVRELDRCGHEVQTHGYDHTEITRQAPRAFRADIARAKAAVEDSIGRPVTAYRAPRFSLTERTAWALDVLAEEGFRVDSSVFPMRIRGYGIRGWYPGPHRLRCRSGAELIELPVATLDVVPWGRVPLGGGGYYRLLPLPLIRWGLRRIEARGQPAVMYCHPYEFDPNAIWDKRLALPLHCRLHQGLGRKAFARRIDAILTEFPVGRIRDLLGQLKRTAEPGG